MRIGIISETYPPEINGVALTVHGLASGLAAKGHQIDLIRPRQNLSHADEPGIHALETRGAALPRYPGLRFGLPSPDPDQKHSTHSEYREHDQMRRPVRRELPLR